MNRSIWSLLKQLRQPDDPGSDAALLWRYTHGKDESAFELLVWRHGGLVLGVCRRILKHEQAAEDAFQATFLILARKAHSVRGSLSGWLYQVARRVCLRARKQAFTLNSLEIEPPAVESPDSVLTDERDQLLDEEVGRLPEKYRLVVILCYLQNLSAEEAAGTLGIPRGTVLSRLHQARQMLCSRLTRRGVVAPAALLTVANFLPELPANICRPMTKLANEFLNGSLKSHQSIRLAREVLNMMARKTAFGITAFMILTTGVGSSVGYLMAQGRSTAEVQQKPVQKEAPKPPEPVAEVAPPAQPPEDVERRRRMEAQAELEKVHEIVARRLTEKLEEVSRRLAVQVEQHSVMQDNKDVNPKLLKEKLETLDRDHLKTEDVIKETATKISEAEANLKLHEAGQLPTDQPTVERMILDTEEIRMLNSQLNQAKTRVSKLRALATEDNQKLQDAQAELQKLEQSLEPTKKKLYPVVEKKYQELIVRNLNTQIKTDRQTLEQSKKWMKSLEAERAALRERIRRAEGNVMGQKLMEDEIEALRDVRKELMRALILHQTRTPGVDYHFPAVTPRK